MDDKHEQWKQILGIEIRRRRTEQSLTLEALSRLSGVEAASLSRLERGMRDPKLSTLVQIATALRLELPDLFRPDTPDAPVEKAVQGYDLDDE